MNTPILRRSTLVSDHLNQHFDTLNPKARINPHFGLNLETGVTYVFKNSHYFVRSNLNFNTIKYSFEREDISINTYGIAHFKTEISHLNFLGNFEVGYITPSEKFKFSFGAGYNYQTIPELNSSVEEEYNILILRQGGISITLRTEYCYRIKSINNVIGLSINGITSSLYNLQIRSHLNNPMDVEFLPNTTICQVYVGVIL